MLQHEDRPLTPKEYLVYERKAENKSEYVNGALVAMAGASRIHNLISANIVRVLGNQLMESPCSVYASDMKIKVEPTKNYFYPDIVMACEPEKYEDENRDVLLNPMIIMEILSASTEAHDRGRKFADYQLIHSLIEYTLISQEFQRVENFKRQGDKTWLYSEFQSNDEILILDSADCELPIAEIYRKVNLREHHLKLVH